MMTAAVLCLASQALFFGTNTCAVPLDRQKDEKQGIQYGYPNPLYDYDRLPTTNYGGTMLAAPQEYLDGQRYPTSAIYPGPIVYPASMGFLASQGYPVAAGYAGTIGFPLSQGYDIGGASYNGYPHLPALIQPGLPLMYRKKVEQRGKSRH